MITCWKDYRDYLVRDRRALNRSLSIGGWVADDVWRYQRRLRTYEFLLNTGHRVPAAFAYLRMTKLGNRLGFSIGPNVFGPGLSIAHPGTLAVNEHARVGANCRISVNVTIGSDLYQSDAAPVIGDDCFLGPGACVLGAVTLGNNVKVGANAVVTRSFAEDNLTLAGVPAKVLSSTEARPAAYTAGAND